MRWERNGGCVKRKEENGKQERGKEVAYPDGVKRGENNL